MLIKTGSVDQPKFKYWEALETAASQVKLKSNDPGVEVDLFGLCAALTL